MLTGGKINQTLSLRNENLIQTYAVKMIKVEDTANLLAIFPLPCEGVYHFGLDCLRMFQWERSANCFGCTNVPTGTLNHIQSAFTPNCFPFPTNSVNRLIAYCSGWNTQLLLGNTSAQIRECSGWNIGHVLHTNSSHAQGFGLAFEIRGALFLRQLWLLDNLWDALSLLPIRRAAWARLRLPSI
jgi:hypothetical protein